MKTNPADRLPDTRMGARQLTKKTVYWFKIVFQPIMAIIFIVGMAWLFGFLQRHSGWFNDASTSATVSTEKAQALYACSMLCVFVKAPGRCPVCGMELQKIESQGDPKDIFGVTIDPTSRRLANIETVAALNLPVAKKTEVLGRITYDETALATISAYVDGRIERMMVDFTGATVRKGDELAVVYSPELYADQVALLSTKKAIASSNVVNERVARTNQRMYESARQRLIEFGITELQIDTIETSGKPDSRIKIFAPESGTVVEKMAEPGQYIKTGMPILKIADLNKVWLMLEMFPEDTNDLKIGQAVEVSIQSQPGRTFEGQISFIDPIINPKTQTLNVRVAMSNEAGLLKIGDFGRARIETESHDSSTFVVVPRDSVLVNGSNSVAYVETQPGRFEFRTVEIAQIMGDKIALAAGIQPGEQVVASGVFMLDSTFNIQGKVSLIDPNRAEVKNEAVLADAKAEAREIEESFSLLSTEDRELAEVQVICPVTEVKLGTLGMGKPIRVSLNDRDLMICCEGCRTGLLENPKKYLAILDKYHGKPPIGEELAEIEESFSKLSVDDRKLAEEQIICPVTEIRLGTMGMGTPIKVDVDGTPVMICCEGCRKRLVGQPGQYLEILDKYQDVRDLYTKASSKSSPPAERRNQSQAAPEEPK